MIITHKTVKITTSTEACIEHLQEEPNLTYFKRMCLHFQPSLERVARCTLVIKPYNEIICDYADPDLCTFVRQSAHLEANTPITIWKNRDLKVIKLTFTNISTAEAVKTNGFKIGAFHIPSHQISFG